MKHILEHWISSNRLHKGSINGRDYESFEVILTIYDDEKNIVYDEKSEYQKFDILLGV